MIGTYRRWHWRVGQMCYSVWDVGWVRNLVWVVVLFSLALTLLKTAEPGFRWSGLDPKWWPFVYEVVLAFAIALFTAPVLMLLVERPMSKARERDVFRAVMGYLLPDAIRDELQWVYSMKLVCVRSRIVCTVRPLDTDRVTFDLRIERTFKNFNTKPEGFCPTFDLEEWCHSEQTRIVKVGARQGATVFTGTAPRLDGDEPRWRASLAEPLVLEPSGEVEVWYEGREIRHAHDHHMMVFLTPTLDPEVVVDIPDEFGRTVHFRDGRRPKDEVVRPEPGRRWVLRGTMLPFQATEVRWWVAAEVAALRERLSAASVAVH